MEYIRIVGEMAGGGGGGVNITPEKTYLLIAIAVVAILIGLVLSRKPG